VLVRVDSRPQRHELREVVHRLRWLVRTGAPWRMLQDALLP
jgi:transposase